MKLLCGIILFISIPVIDLSIIFIFFEDDFGLYFRLGFLFIMIECIVALLYHNYNVCTVSNAAHSIYPKLNSLIAKRKLNPRTKSKVIGLIEKISESELSFTCMNWFPLNNFESLLFIVNCIHGFILTIGLIK
jgi:hypothetical protein